VGYDSADEWSYWCFIGFAPVSANEIDDFRPELVQSLFSMVEAQAVVGTVSPLDPRYLINHKGVTAWHALYVLALINDREGLEAVSEGRAMLLVPGYLRTNYSSHVNWPEQLLNRFRLEPRGSHPFVLPFILHNSAPRPQQLQRSLRAPDGALEIWGVAEFDVSEPAKLLWEVQRLAEHIDREREQSQAAGA
jgi:hypothetical protein